MSTCLEARFAHYPLLSPIFHFAKSRASASQGMDPRIAVSTTRRHGVCAHSLHEHGLTRADLALPISRDATRDGRRRRLARPPRVLSSHALALDIYAALERSHPVFLEIWPDRTYWDMRNPGVCDWHVTGNYGGSVTHAVAVIGFDRNRQSFIAQDSRGKDFGKAGQWYVRADYMNKRTIIQGREIR